MAKTIALIVAGSGEADIEEVTDLLNDAYPEDKYDIDLVIPVGKALFNDTVKNVAEWLNDPERVYPVLEKDDTMSRASSKYGAEDALQEVESFETVLNPDDFKDWDEVEFLVAMPEPGDETEYDLYAGMVETAIDNGLKVKNLCAGLDDVVLEDEPEPEPEPEPEVKEVKKRAPAKTLEKEEPEAKISKGEFLIPKEVLSDLQQVVKFLEKNDEMFALRNLADEVVYAPITKAAQGVWKALAFEEVGEPAEAPEEPQEPAEAPKKGRGRPRTNFEVKEIYDEDEEQWVPRPKGRTKKGTQWRVRHAETDEILDEGTV